ncbi:hypothetical protein [Kordiimonas aestuarii]|uniref:hypothetical protein n=1 Tax=Kordiimonas aestuarii TaxID=1005925 RepID=UPI0021D16498|nr:hypothetical protein [Kordiimonas aestuarii]
MLGAIINYAIYGSMLFCFGILLYKLWDRVQSDKATAKIRSPEWLEQIEHDEETAPPTFSQQEIYTFSQRYISVIRSVFASPTPSKLQQLNGLLAASQNLSDQLWKDMSVRLTQAHLSYPLEYAALIETVASCSNNPIQQYAAYRLATSFPDGANKFSHLAKSIAASPLTQAAMARARKLA